MTRHCGMPSNGHTSLRTRNLYRSTSLRKTSLVARGALSPGSRSIARSTTRVPTSVSASGPWCRSLGLSSRTRRCSFLTKLRYAVGCFVWIALKLIVDDRLRSTMRRIRRSKIPLRHNSRTAQSYALLVSARFSPPLLGLGTEVLAQTDSKPSSATTASASWTKEPLPRWIRPRISTRLKEAFSEACAREVRSPWRTSGLRQRSGRSTWSRRNAFHAGIVRYYDEHRISGIIDWDTDVYDVTTENSITVLLTARIRVVGDRFRQFNAHFHSYIPR
jgi:hypothetical protein